MKRGALWPLMLVAIALALLPAVHGETSTIGTYHKSAGQNWTADNHDLSIIIREKEDPYFVYLRFDAKVEGISSNTCASFGVYRVCFLNSSLGVVFDPETRRSPYVYQIKVTAISADASATMTAEKTKLLVGEETRAELRIQSEGDLPIHDMQLRLASTAVEFRNVFAPCRLVDNVIIFSDPLGNVDEAICTFKIVPLSRNLTTLTPKLNFSNGRKNVSVSGTSLTIDAREQVVGVVLANNSMKLGTIVKGMVNINNSDEEEVLTVTGSLQAPNAEIIGPITIRQRLDPKTSVGLPFELRLTRTGNVSVMANVTIERGTSRTRIIDGTSVRVSFPPLVLKHYGQLSLAQPGPANVQIEAENKGDIPLRRVQITFHPPEGVTMPTMSVPIDILPGRNEQIYVATVTVPFNNVIVPIPLNITLTTELGENLTFNSNLTIRTGTAAKSLVPTVPPAKKNGTTPSSSTTNTTTGSANDTAAGQPAGNIPTTTLAAQRSTTNTLLIIIMISLVAGAIFWFLSMAAMGRGPKKTEKEWN